MYIFIYCLLFFLTILGLILFVYDLKTHFSKADPDSSFDPPRWLKSTYLKLYLLALAIEWLQSPYLYRLYADYCVFSQKKIALLYICGVVTSPILMPMVALLTERLKPFKTITLFSLLILISTIIKPSKIYRLHIVSRIVTTIATPGLLVSIDDWHNHEIFKIISYSSGKTVNSTQSKPFKSIFHLSIASIAIFSGLLADFVAEFLGFGNTAPFLTSLIPLVCVFYTQYKYYVKIGISSTPISFTPSVILDEQPKDCICAKCVLIGLSETLSILKSQGMSILLAPLLQSLIDCSIYVFVFSWTPLLELWAKRTWSELVYMPLGAISSCFMAGIIIGGITFQLLVNHRVDPRKILTIILVLIFFFNLIISTNIQLTHNGLYGCLLMLVSLEILYGIYSPCIQWIRDHLIPLQITRNKFNNLIFDCGVRTPLNMMIIFFILVPLTPRAIKVEDGGLSVKKTTSSNYFFVINPQKLFYASSFLALFSILVSYLIRKRFSSQLSFYNRSVHPHFQFIVAEP